MFSTKPLSQITSNLASGVYKIRPISNSKSDVWQQFGVVTCDDTDLDYVACKSCHVAIKYAGRQTGTSTMKRHKCRVPSSQSSIVSHCVSNVSKVSKNEKACITRSCADFVCRDLRPFETVAGDGFVSMAQSLLNLQHKHNTLLQAKDILPHPTTVSRSVDDREAIVISELSALIQQAFSNTGHVSFTSDMWTDAHRQRSYITITTHWITDDWTLISRVICTEQFDPTEKKTGVNVKAAILAVFSTYGVTNVQLDNSSQQTVDPI
jgi:hypothetical protein